MVAFTPTDLNSLLTETTSGSHKIYRETLQGLKVPMRVITNGEPSSL